MLVKCVGLNMSSQMHLQCNQTLYITRFAKCVSLCVSVVCGSCVYLCDFVLFIGFVITGSNIHMHIVSLVVISDDHVA